MESTKGRPWAEQAQAHWVQATTLIAWLVNEKGMSFRVAHQILSLVAQRVVDKKLSPQAITVEMVEAAAVEHTGKKLGLTEQVLRHTLDAWTGVTGRKYRGGTSPKRVAKHIAAAKKHLSADAAAWKKRTQVVARAETKRDAAFAKLKQMYR